MQWEQFTKRTNDPKLSWLQRELTRLKIKNRRHGYSSHAPILEVDARKLDKAWEILDPIDDLPDDHHTFQQGYESCEISSVYDDEESMVYFDRFIAGDR